MPLDLGDFIWFVLPALVSLFLLIKSLLNSLNNKTLANWTLAVLIWTAIIFSGIMLYNMFFEQAYPTYLPHLIIVGCILLLLFQSSKQVSQ
jgi:hypothetical protein